MWTWPKKAPGKVVRKLSEAFYEDEDCDGIIPLAVLADGILVKIDRSIVQQTLESDHTPSPDQKSLLDQVWDGEGSQSGKIVPMIFPAFDGVWLMGSPITAIRTRVSAKADKLLVVENGDTEIARTLLKIAQLVLHRELKRDHLHVMFAVPDIRTVDEAYKANQ